MTMSRLINGTLAGATKWIRGSSAGSGCVCVCVDGMGCKRTPPGGSIYTSDILHLVRSWFSLSFFSTRKRQNGHYSGVCRDNVTRTRNMQTLFIYSFSSFFLFALSLSFSISLCCQLHRHGLALVSAVSGCFWGIF